MGTQGEITLLHESSHFVPVQFGESFFKQFDLAMKLRKQELKKQGKVEAELSEVTEGNVAKAFGVTKDHMLEAAKILQDEENTENLDTQKRYYSFKQIAPRAQHLKLMLVAWYFLLYLIQVHKSTASNMIWWPH